MVSTPKPTPVRPKTPSAAARRAGADSSSGAPPSSSRQAPRNASEPKNMRRPPRHSLGIASAPSAMPAEMSSSIAESMPAPAPSTSTT